MADYYLAMLVTNVVANYGIEIPGTDRVIFDTGDPNDVPRWLAGIDPHLSIESLNHYRALPPA